MVDVAGGWRLSAGPGVEVGQQLAAGSGVASSWRPAAGLGVASGWRTAAVLGVASGWWVAAAAPCYHRSPHCSHFHLRTAGYNHAHAINF